jgi:hypothetical protein
MNVEAFGSQVFSQQFGQESIVIYE